jgi:hypothetical protein
MSVEDRPIVGSAEPLSPEQARMRLRELEAWGVDLSLVCASLQESPAERLDHMLGVLAFTHDLRRAWQRQYGTALPVAHPSQDEASQT